MAPPRHSFARDLASWEELVWYDMITDASTSTWDGHGLLVALDEEVGVALVHLGFEQIETALRAAGRKVIVVDAERDALGRMPEHTSRCLTL